MRRSLKEELSRTYLKDSGGKADPGKENRSRKKIKRQLGQLEEGLESQVNTFKLTGLESKR